VNTANVTLLPCNQCHKRAQGRSSHGRTAGYPLEPPLSTSDRNKSIKERI